MERRKKKYSKPTQRVIELEYDRLLLTGSGSAKINPWTDGPGNPGNDLELEM